MMKRSRIDYMQQYIDHGYQELTIDATADGAYAMSPNHLHIWPRGHFMMIALPNLDKSFTTTLFMPFRYFDELRQDASKVVPFFRQHFPDAIVLLGGEVKMTEAVMKNAVGSMISIKCSPYAYERCVYIGDAAHAIVPFYGQGMNAGFEDVNVLVRFLFPEVTPESATGVKLSKHGEDSTAAYDFKSLAGKSLQERLQAYSEYRKPDAHAICDLAMYNYEEMRGGVLSWGYRARKFIETWLHWLMP